MCILQEIIEIVLHDNNKGMDRASERNFNHSPVDFNQFRAATLAFINDLTKSSSGHCGPLDEESDIIKKQLDQLNRLDCVTIDSQPFDTFTVKDVKYKSKPFVYFYFPKRKAEDLIDLIDCDDLFIAMWNQSGGLFLNNKEKFEAISNKIGYFGLNRQLVNDKWEEDYGTSFNPYYMFDTFESYIRHINSDMYKYGCENLVLINVIGLDYSNSTFDKIIKAAHSLFFD